MSSSENNLQQQDFSQEREPHPENPWVLLARIVRPQGRKGELLADILTDFPERFDQRRELYLIPPPKSVTPAPKVILESNWIHKGRIVLKFIGVDTISDAELLRGYEVAIPREQRAILEDGSFYISDLIGCSVFNSSDQNARVGEITAVDRESTSAPLLVLGTGDDAILIPFVRAWLHNIDLETKRIEMSLPEGLLDINNL